MRSTLPRRCLSLTLVLLAGCSTDGNTADTLPTGVSAAAGGNGSPGVKNHPAGKIIGTVTAFTPWAVAVRDDGLAFFTQLFGDNVGITNTATRVVTGTIPTGSLPTGIVFSPDGSRAYTANQGDNTVTVIDAATSTAIGSISTGASSPFSVEMSPDGQQLYVGNNDNTLMIVDTRLGQVTRTLYVGEATNAFAVAPDGARLYASHFVSGSVTEIDIATASILRTFDVGGVPQGLALNKKGTHLYVANEDGYLNDIVLATGASGAPIPVAGPAFGIGVTPDDHEAWIAIPSTGQVQVFNLQGRRLSGAMDVGGEPRRIAFSAQGKIGAVTDVSGNVIFVR